MLTKKCGIWHLIAGIIMLILGFVVWANPLSSLYAIAIYVGAILFILGCGYITFSFSESSAWYFVIGLMCAVDFSLKLHATLRQLRSV